MNLAMYVHQTHTSKHLRVACLAHELLIGMPAKGRYWEGRERVTITIEGLILTGSRFSVEVKSARIRMPSGATWWEKPHEIDLDYWDALRKAYAEHTIKESPAGDRWRAAYALMQEIGWR